VFFEFVRAELGEWGVLQSDILFGLVRGGCVG